MYMPHTLHIYPRGDPTGLPQKTIIIIAVCSAVGAIVVSLLLFRMIRNWRRSRQSAPLPPVQPLAHHREQQLAKFENSLPRTQTWYEPRLPAPRALGSDSPSQTSLLGREQLGSSPSYPSTCTSHEDGTQVVEMSPQPFQDRHLPLPSPSFHTARPGSSSSLTSKLSSDASCTSPPSGEQFPTSPDGAAPLVPRSVSDLRSSSAPGRRPRPLSMSSTYSRSTNISRTSRHSIRGMPHAPHNQIQIVLPTPLGSASQSRESMALPGRRGEAGGFDRRSIADPWISVGSSTLGERQNSISTESLPLTAPSPRQPPLPMMSSTSTGMQPTSHQHHPHIPPIPPLPPNSRFNGLPARTPRSVSDSQWIHSDSTAHQAVEDENEEFIQKKAHKLQKRSVSQSPRT